MATVKNLIIDQGTTFSLSITVSDITGAPLDLSTYIARSAMKKNFNSLSSISLNATINDPISGEVTISLSPDQTASLKPGRYVYDIEVSNVVGFIGSNGYQGSQGINLDVIRVLEGIITINPEVS